MLESKERSPRKEKKKPKKPKYVYTYGYEVTKEKYPARLERAKKEKAIARMVIQLLATVRLPKWT